MLFFEHLNKLKVKLKTIELQISFEVITFIKRVSYRIRKHYFLWQQTPVYDYYIAGNLYYFLSILKISNKKIKVKKL
jgi:hypothetical protein